MRKTNKTTTENLVDLSNVEIDTTEPIEKRIKHFLKHVRNPRAFKIGDITIEIESISDKSFYDALASVYRQEDGYDSR